MDDNTLDEIKRMVEALDAKLPQEGAAVQFMLHGGAKDECQIEANELGYMRMGIEFLKAGIAPVGKAPGIIVADIDGLVTKNSEVQFVSFMRTEELQPPPTSSASWVKDRLGLLGCAFFAFVVAVVMIGGVLFWCGVSLSD